MIKEIIVVEGKEDTRRLKEVFGDIHTIETRGSAIDEDTINLIRKAQQTHGVIIFTDPDYPGQKIRKVIEKRVPGCRHAYIEKDKAICAKKHKVGVEHCCDEDLRTALANLTHVYPESSPITFKHLLDWGLVAGNNSSAKREYLGKKLSLGHNNAKQLLQKLQLFNIPISVIESLLVEFETIGR